MNEKSRDQHARRRLRRLGYHLYKARPSGPWLNEYPYMIIDSDRNMAVTSTLSIEQVEAWLDEVESEDEE